MTTSQKFHVTHRKISFKNFPLIIFINFIYLFSQQQMAPQVRPGMPMAAPGMPMMPMAGQPIAQQPILTQQMPQAQPANIQLDPFGA